MITCPACKKDIPDDSRYCDLCGVKLMFCPKCGGAPKRGKRCTQCGEQLVGADQLTRTPQNVTGGNIPTRPATAMKPPQTHFDNLPDPDGRRIWVADVDYGDSKYGRDTDMTFDDYEAVSRKAIDGDPAAMIRKVRWEMDLRNLRKTSASAKDLVTLAFQNLDAIIQAEISLSSVAKMLLGDLFFMPLYHCVDMDMAMKWYLEAADEFMRAGKRSNAVYCYEKAAWCAAYLEKTDKVMELAAKLENMGSQLGNIVCARYSRHNGDSDSYNRYFSKVCDSNDPDGDFFMMRNSLPVKNSPDDVYDYDEETLEGLISLAEYDGGYYSGHVGRPDNTWTVADYDRMSAYHYLQYTLDPAGWIGGDMHKSIDRGINKGSLWAYTYMGLIAYDNMRDHISQGDRTEAEKARRLAGRYLRTAIDNGNYDQIWQYIFFLEETGADAQLCLEYLGITDKYPNM